MNGLTGQATLQDSTGTLDVHVQIVRISPEMATRFRAGATVVLKGTMRKFSTLVRTYQEHDRKKVLSSDHSTAVVCPFLNIRLATLTRMTVDSGDDVDFVRNIGGVTAALEVSPSSDIRDESTMISSQALLRQAVSSQPVRSPRQLQCRLHQRQAESSLRFHRPAAAAPLFLKLVREMRHAISC